MGDKTAIGWTFRTWNAWRGCKMVSPGCANCLAPDTLVLFQDFTWKPLSSVVVGSELATFDESIVGGRKYRKSVVQAVRVTKERALRIKTVHSSVIASYNHLFLRATGNHWMQAGKLSLQSPGLRFIDLYTSPTVSDSYKQGYVVGMTDGDGTFCWDGDEYEPGWGSVWCGESPQCYWRVAVADVAILDRLQRYLADFNIVIDKKPFDSGSGILPMSKLETRKQEHLMCLHSWINLSRPVPTFGVGTDKEFFRGWLAGIFDAKGNNGDSLRISNADDAILTKIVVFGTALGFEFQIERYVNCPTARLLGGMMAKNRFFGIVQPVLQRKIDEQFGVLLQTKISPVLSVEDIGIVDLIDIQTDTGTFFANGFATHNCYMFRDQRRYGLDPTVVTRTKTWGQPKKWQKEAAVTNTKQMCFTCSWSDWFIEAADAWRPEAWKIVKDCPNIIFQILTKRPHLIPARLPPDWGDGYDNVGLGVSVESAPYLSRIDELRQIKAKVHFISAEPLLGSLKGIDLTDIEWLIAGGESGDNFRIMDLDWARELRDECNAKGVPFFYKQNSNRLPGRDNILDGRPWEQWPDSWLN